MRTSCIALFCVLPLMGFAPPKTTPKSATDNHTSQTKLEPKILPRIRPACPVRLGGVYLLGLGDSADPFEDSANLGTKLSADNAKWIPEVCDVIALDANTIKPNTFRDMVKAEPLFTPLLYVYASSLYEQPEHHGNVGGWKPEMNAWTLRDSKGDEVKHPDKGGHWMDFSSKQWAAYWQKQVVGLVNRYGAQGVVAAELPADNTFINEGLQKYKTPLDRAAATTAWLGAAHAPNRFLLIPSALGFDALAGHSTLPPKGPDEPELSGRLWDEAAPSTDGAWVEGWIRPYWSDAPLVESEWERQMQAADRAANDPNQVFIAAAAYSNEDELEYALSSYLLITKSQGRVVFQPMPLVPGQKPDAGFSLAVLKKEIQEHPRFFNVRLGVAQQVRHLVTVDPPILKPILKKEDSQDGVAQATGSDAQQNGLSEEQQQAEQEKKEQEKEEQKNIPRQCNIWKRNFQYGVVYVNSSDDRTAVIALGAVMKRLNGSKIRQVTMPPHSGVVLLYR